MALGDRTPLKIIPHFMRLHEWIALEERYYQAEGLEPELLPEVMHQVSGHRGEAYKERPQDRPFLDALPAVNSACHWGSICNAGAGMGRFVPDLYGVARFGTYLRPGSTWQRLTDLRGVPVGVGVMAGSHFTTLQTLEKVLPRDQIVSKNFGGPGRRLQGLLTGEIEAATLLDPEIPIAELRGLRKVAMGEFKTLFWVHERVEPAALSAYFRVLRRADEALRAGPETYLPLWARNVPPELRGDYDYRAFGLGELLFFEPYAQRECAEALAFAEGWKLAGEIQDRDYGHLIAPVSS
jgi:NitT/TauT family transport system substrate-binding protein